MGKEIPVESEWTLKTAIAGPITSFFTCIECMHLAASPNLTLQHFIFYFWNAFPLHDRYNNLYRNCTLHIRGSEQDACPSSIEQEMWHNSGDIDPVQCTGTWTSPVQGLSNVWHQKYWPLKYTDKSRGWQAPAISKPQSEQTHSNTLHLNIPPSVLSILDQTNKACTVGQVPCSMWGASGQNCCRNKVSDTRVPLY